jgi:hypothetical protein
MGLICDIYSICSVSTKFISDNTLPNAKLRKFFADLLASDGKGLAEPNNPQSDIDRMPEELDADAAITGARSWEYRRSFPYHMNNRLKYLEEEPSRATRD